MTSNQLMLAVSMASFGIQQVVQILLDPFVTKYIRKQMDATLSGGVIVIQKLYDDVFLETEAKKFWLGRASFFLGILVAWQVPIRILETVAFTPSKEVDQPSPLFRFMDVLITGLVLGAGTEGANSVLKWVQYAKDGKKLLAAGGAAVPAEASSNASGPIVQSSSGLFSTLLVPGVSFKPCQTPANVLNPALITLIFWGDTWLNNSTANGFAAITGRDYLWKILDKAYLEKLTQYGVSATPKITAAFVEGGTIPEDYTFETVVQVIQDTIQQNALTTSQGALFTVILPRSVALPVNDKAFHSNQYFTGEGELVTLPWPYMLVGHDGSLDNLSFLFSHEVIEACTNPDGLGWREVGNCSSSNWKELVDVCPDSFTGKINGAKVSGYWSEKDHACVAPM